MNELIPLFTVSVITGFWSWALVAFIAARVVTKSAIVLEVGPHVPPHSSYAFPPGS